MVRGKEDAETSQKCTQERKEVKSTSCEILIYALIEAKHVLVDLGFGFRLVGFSTVRVFKHWNCFPEQLENLHPGRH